MIINHLKVQVNNIKMSKFSQINQTTKRKKQLGFQPSIEFKIQPPQNEKKAKELIPQSSFFEQLEKSNSSVLKNTVRSSFSDKLQQQYISFKLKPTKLNKDTIEANNDYKLDFQKKHHVWPQHKFIEPELQIMESQKSSFAKSPEFVCKRASFINSEKQSFSGSLQQNLNLQNTQSSSSHSFKITKGTKFVKEDKDKVKIAVQCSNFSQFKESREQYQKDEFIFASNENIYKYEASDTPIKGLKEQFGRKSRAFPDSKKFLNVPQFDSFNQENFKDNFIQFVPQQKLDFDNIRTFERKSLYGDQTQNKNLKMKIKNQIENRDQNKEFFFLTDPTLQQSEKKIKIPVLKEITKTSKQKEVEESCFNISQIKFQDEKQKESYCNPNLFSNSNEYLLLFSSKDSPKGQIYINNSKRSHIRQMVEEFIQQLQHVDDKSLNEKVVNNLQNLLEQIVFKDPKHKYQPTISQDLKITRRQENQDEIKSFYDETKFKKWTKPQRNSDLSLIPAIRQKFNEIKEENRQLISQYYEQNLSPNPIILSNYSIEKKKEQSPNTERKDITSKSNKKPTIYKPNFDFDGSKSVHKRHSSRLKSQLSPPKNVMFTKYKHVESTEIKINPKSSIYFNNKKNNRQHLKTENTRKTWRVY